MTWKFLIMLFYALPYLLTIQSSRLQNFTTSLQDLIEILEPIPRLNDQVPAIRSS